MALAADAPKPGFRLSQLIYDTRYRSYTIQFSVLVLLALFLSWLTNNVIENLAKKGKDIDFSFLWGRAGYDLAQHLIPYTNDSSHFQALLVGLINTLVVAVVASIFATLLGVLIGVLRLSKNWIISRLMSVYIEIFRNVPLVLWIILVYVVLSEIRPQPKDFKPAADGTAKASMWLWDSVAVTNRSTSIPAPMLDRPLPDVLGLSGWLVALVVVLGGSIWVVRWLNLRARRIQESTGDRPATWWQSLLILIVPTAALLWAQGFHLDLPVLKGFDFQGGIRLAHAFTALTLALALYYAAVTAEIVRGGIQAINRGQTEASFALGLRPGITTRLVILPQALRVIIPPQISNYLSLTKDTSLGIAVSYLDLRGTLGGITLNQTGRELECMLLMMGIYLCISLIISGVLNFYNASVKLKER